MQRVISNIGHGLYKAAKDLKNSVDRPLWHVGAGITLFAGRLDYHEPHSHAVPLLLAGLYEPFLIRIEGGDWHKSNSAVIPPAVAYELHGGGMPIAVCYLEPHYGDAAWLQGLIDKGDVVGSAVFGRFEGQPLLRHLFENPKANCMAGDIVEEIFSSKVNEDSKGIDPRVCRVITLDKSWADEPISLRSAAQIAGVSPSRFQHLFRQNLGISYSRYCGWQRLRLAIGEVTEGSNLTGAAHAAGYFDQSHFSRQFYKSFGAAPSKTLSNIRRCE